MKKFIFLFATLVSMNAYATQEDRDKELIRELEMSAEYKALDQKSALKKSESKVSRIVKVKLKKPGLAKRLAEELDLKLVAGKKKKVATFKVRMAYDLDATLDQLLSHPDVVKVKHEHVMNKYVPQ